MKVRGVVTQVEEAKKNGQGNGKGKPEDGPLYFVSIEGFSLLMPVKAAEVAALKLPEQGREVVALVEVLWRKGAKPLHFLRSWVAVALAV